LTIEFNRNLANEKFCRKIGKLSNQGNFDDPTSVGVHRLGDQTSVVALQQPVIITTATRGVTKESMSMGN
jgi:hypothetical protein